MRVPAISVPRVVSPLRFTPSSRHHLTAVRSLPALHARGSHMASSAMTAGGAAKGGRRFAPLGEGRGKGDAPVLKGIVFDVDGTLCEPQSKMFVDMRSALNIPRTTDILDHIAALPPSSQLTAHASLRAIETRYMREQTAQPGLTDLMAYLSSRGVRRGICTRNFEGPVQHLLATFLGGNGEGVGPPTEETKAKGTDFAEGGEGRGFWPIVTRAFEPPKPHPAGILHIAESWGLVREGEGGGVVGDASGLIMVGDSMDDMLAGSRAGAATVLISHGDNTHVGGSGVVDLVIERLDDLIAVLEEGFEGVPGGVKDEEGA